ncbi:hypothetical protein ACFWV1_25980 [Streptomyces sp. NPDC058700]|uniref:hypothetical protein n=1 Tax=Streptomyces sp. NPDC058700 TaxID=3346607 RepID=UPI003652ABB2
MKTPLILGREPAAWLSLVAIIVKLAAAFGWNASPETQANVNAVAAAAMGILIAVMVHDGLGAAIIGFAQGGLALSLGYGLDWSSEKQVAAMAFVTLVVGMWDRTQVTARVPAKQPLPLA